MNDVAATWDQLCDNIRAFGHEALESSDELDRVEGLRHALRFLWNQSLTHIEAADPARPAFRRIVDATMKYFGDAPDVDYWSAPIDARCEYRIRGTRGSTKHLSVCVYRTTVQDRVAANLADEALGVNPDGTFELWVSKTPKPGPGLLIDDTCNIVSVREYHHVRSSERSSVLEIEQITTVPGPREPLTVESFEAGLARAVRGMAAAPRLLRHLNATLEASPNTLRNGDEVNLTSLFFGTTSNKYLLGAFRLEPGQGLQFTIPSVAAAYTGVQICNRWFESFEWRDHQVSLNDATWTTNADGSATVTISDTPTPSNWLDTCGHRYGLIIVRFLECHDEIPPQLNCNVIDVGAHAR